MKFHEELLRDGRVGGGQSRMVIVCEEASKRAVGSEKFQ